MSTSYKIKMISKDRVDRIFDRLQDEESKRLFDLRIDYLVRRNDIEYMYWTNKIYNDWSIIDIDLDNSFGVVICGAGHNGIICKNLLCHMGYKINCFTDRYLKGQIDGIQIYSLANAVKKYPNGVFLISSSRIGDEVKQELLNLNVKKERIIPPKYDYYLVASRGKQYFDVFPPGEKECFVDAGAYDGSTIRDFIEWTKGSYNKIIALEPMGGYKTIRKKYYQNSKINIYDCAAWDKIQELTFSEADSASRYCINGGNVVQGISIDEIIKEQKVTFIKMDIEGSELKALVGAKNSIKNNKPKLAICIYHKPTDFIELADYILSLCPDYKLYIRKYFSNMWEEVLYAV